MSLLIVSILTILGIALGRIVFKVWFNHLSMYSSIMGGLVFFYELKLLPYPDVIPLAWFYIIAAFLSYVFGILTIISAKNLYNEEELHKSQLEDPLPAIFDDNGKALKYSILLFSFIGLFVAIHRWTILLDMFGSVPAILLKAAVIYRMNVEGEIKGFIPILPSFVYVGVFLSGIYSAYRGKFTFLSFFPLFCIVLKELTYFGRGEMLFASMEFVFTFLLVRHLLKRDRRQRFRFSKKNAYIALSILIVVIVTAASMVRTVRGVKETYQGASKNLRQLQENFFIGPSVYLYISSDVGVFSKYLELEKESTSFGQNTFRSFYDLLSKFDIVDDVSFFQKGYFIPMWTNTGTYIRELYADFGPQGVLFGSFFLGALITWLWFKFYESKNLIVLMVLVYFYIIVGFTFLMMVTRLNQWFFSQFLILLYLPILQKIVARQKTINL